MTTEAAGIVGESTKTESVAECCNTHYLPGYRESATPNFRWGQLDGVEFIDAILGAYAEVVHWRRNVFLVPSGKIGKQFVQELASLFLAFAQGSAMESIAIHAAMLACPLLLQKPHHTSKSRDHVEALERRLRAWREGDINGLMREGRTIQHHLKPPRKTDHQESEPNARIFAKLVLEGKVHSAMRFLTESHGGGVLGLDDYMDDREERTVFDVLEEKHPSASPADEEALVTTTEDPPEVHPIIFQSLTGAQIRKAALRTHGSAGPSGVDAIGWRRLCTGFKRESNDLCDAKQLLLLADVYVLI